mmetsp:Transcript_14865/g.21931  ORF Transcript_14865/g.21931 Transcript_14865/m.21931 type:complete len:180 (-) Transcript_14865:96-635(-)
MTSMIRNICDTSSSSKTSSNSLMASDANGSFKTPVQQQLRWGCDRIVADRICKMNNHHHSEYAGYFLETNFLNDLKRVSSEMKFYDSITGRPLFIAPRGRSMDDFIIESRNEGWLSFRDDEVVWSNVRILDNGEAVSVDGTHLGHDMPDKGGSRYIINIVSVAGTPNTKRHHQGESRDS